MSSRWYLSAVAAMLLLQLGTPAFGEPGDDTGPWRRDPFRAKKIPATVGASQELPSEPLTEDLILKGIIRGTDGRYRALINNQEYLAGESCAGVHIRKVTRFGIVVEDADGIRKVDLFHD